MLNEIKRYKHHAISQTELNELREVKSNWYAHASYIFRGTELITILTGSIATNAHDLERALHTPFGKIAQEIASECYAFEA